MSDFYPATPTGKKGEIKVGYPPATVALANWNRENASASSILLLTHNTTEVEVGAFATGAVGKWLSQAVVDSSVAGTSVISAAVGGNYDFIVGTNTYRRVVVPIATNVANYGSVMGVNRRHGLYPALAIKSFGVGSVMVIEN